MLHNLMLPNVAHPVGTTQTVAAATTRQSDEEVDKVSRRQRFSHTSSTAPSHEDYYIGPGDLTVFPVDPSITHRPAVFEPIATRLRTPRLRELTKVQMRPAAIGNLAGATKHKHCVLRKNYNH
jgi:hypothetical protein